MILIQAIIVLYSMVHHDQLEDGGLIMLVGLA